MIEVLKVLNFLDTNGTVQLKGRVACEVCIRSWREVYNLWNDCADFIRVLSRSIQRMS